MKKRDIEKTMRKRKFFTEKRRLESQELQFFMMSSDNRKLRVKHGAKLFEVLKDQQQVNQQPLSLIETAIPRTKDLLNKQYNDPQLALNNSTAAYLAPNNQNNLEYQKQMIANQTNRTMRRVSSTAQIDMHRPSLVQNLSQPNLHQSGLNRQGSQQYSYGQNSTNQAIQGILLSEYVKDTKFNPVREISKERNITEFFQQKFMLLNEYLSDNNEEDQANGAMSNSRLKAQRYHLMKRAQSQADINNFYLNQQNYQQSSNNLNQYVINYHHPQKTRADQLIEQIEKQVVNQVDREYKYKYDVEAEQIALKQEIQKISDHSKRRIQMFVDPRSQKIRTNFQVLNKNLAEIRKLDPQMDLLQNITNRNRLSSGHTQSRISIRQSIDNIKQSDWKNKSNAEILNEILKIGRK